jgi:uncharacterized repeat protein (TIGR02543 family)
MMDEETDFMPANVTDFDGIETISVPGSYVEHIYGLQYLKNLKHLFLANNELETEALDVLADLPDTLINLNLENNRVTSAALPYMSHFDLNYLNLTGNQICDENLDILPQAITRLLLSNNSIGDVGVDSLVGNLSSLTELDLSNNMIGNVGALKLANIANRDTLTISLENNNIGASGMQVLVNAGFAGLKLNEQVVTSPEISDPRTPIIYDVQDDAAFITSNSISNEGSFDIATGIITWPEQKQDTVFSYKYEVDGYAGTVYIPFKYEPSYYTVTFNDHIGEVKYVSVRDLDKLTVPKEPKRTGYIFKGWTTDEENYSYYDFNSEITSNITLHASWETNNVSNISVKTNSTKISPPPPNPPIYYPTVEPTLPPDTEDNFLVFYCAAIIMLFSFSGMTLCIVLRCRK